MLSHAKDALCVVMGSKSHSMTMMAASVGSALLYGITSTSMAVINKIVLDVYSYDYPLFIITLQMVMTFAILRILHFLGQIKLKPLSKSELLRFTPPCFFYSLNSVLSLAALTEMNLTMYSILKRNGPLVTLILTSTVLRKGMPSPLVMVGISMMSLGCIIAANGDIAFDVLAYSLGIGSVLSKSIHLILLQRLSDEHSTTDILYMNSVLSFPVLAATAAIFGEYTRVVAYSRYNEFGFLLTFTATLVMGSFLNFTLFLCNNNNSALTTSVVGTLRTVVQTIMGMFTFGGVEINPAMLTGICINMTGGIVYTYSKYKDSKKKSLKNSESQPFLEETEEDRASIDSRTSDGTNSSMSDITSIDENPSDRSGMENSANILKLPVPDNMHVVISHQTDTQREYYTCSTPVHHLTYTVAYGSPNNDGSLLVDQSQSEDHAVVYFQ